MNLTGLLTENVSELLIKIVEFTEARQKILLRNLQQVDEKGFEPQDLAVDEFCDLMGTAISEHVRNQRLLLCDSHHVKFGADKGVSAKAVTDEEAAELLALDRDLYLESQLDKLMENSLNQRIAAELLRQKEEV